MATDMESSGDPTNAMSSPWRGGRGGVFHILHRPVGNGLHARVKMVSLYRDAGKRKFSSENSSRQREKKKSCHHSGRISD